MATSARPRTAEEAALAEAFLAAGSNAALITSIRRQLRGVSLLDPVVAFQRLEAGEYGQVAVEKKRRSAAAADLGITSQGTRKAE